jgi:hypothetical protein
LWIRTASEEHCLARSTAAADYYRYGLRQTPETLGTGADDADGADVKATFSFGHEDESCWSGAFPDFSGHTQQRLLAASTWSFHLRFGKHSNSSRKASFYPPATNHTFPPCTADPHGSTEYKFVARCSRLMASSPRYRRNCHFGTGASVGPLRRAAMDLSQSAYGVLEQIRPACAHAEIWSGGIPDHLVVG